MSFTLIPVSTSYNLELNPVDEETITGESKPYGLYAEQLLPEKCSPEEKDSFEIVHRLTLRFNKLMVTFTMNNSYVQGHYASNVDFALLRSGMVFYELAMCDKKIDNSYDVRMSTCFQRFFGKMEHKLRPELPEMIPMEWEHYLAWKECFLKGNETALDKFTAKHGKTNKDMLYFDLIW